jgi:hypothetical protein
MKDVYVGTVTEEQYVVVGVRWIPSTDTRPPRWFARCRGRAAVVPVRNGGYYELRGSMYRAALLAVARAIRRKERQHGRSRAPWTLHVVGFHDDDDDDCHVIIDARMGEPAIGEP